MTDGRLKCCGSAFFLKKQFQVGYNLIFVKEVGCDFTIVTNLLRKYLPNINIATEIGTELSYHLPDGDNSFFKQMLEELENNLQKLRLSSFGVSLTTLEDVFHKTGTKIHNFDMSEGNRRNSDGADILSPHLNENTVLLHGYKLICNQFYGMLKKKMYYWKRNWIIWMPVVLVMAMTLAELCGRLFAEASAHNEPAPLLISLANYIKSVTILDKNRSNASHEFSTK